MNITDVSYSKHIWQQAYLSHTLVQRCQRQHREETPPPRRDEENWSCKFWIKFSERASLVSVDNSCSQKSIPNQPATFLIQNSSKAFQHIASE